jgi:pyruvate/2-oxoglutarate dehydrogenase complex dihydrolipoamide acyltransferase (E2) component
MILRLEVPVTNPSLIGGTVKEWHKSEGEVIGFGDEVCTVAYDQFVALRRTARATLLSGRKAKRLKSNLESRTGKVLMDIVVSAAEQGVLGKILMDPGARFAVGDTLAVISTEPINDFTVPGDLAELATMRVETNASAETELI